MDFTSIVTMFQNPITRDVAITLVCFWLFSAALHGMPTPTADSGLAYRWLYSTAQSLAANFGKLQEAAKPFDNVQTVEAAKVLASKPAELIQAIASAKPTAPLTPIAADNIKVLEDMATDATIPPAKV